MDQNKVKDNYAKKQRQCMQEPSQDVTLDRHALAPLRISTAIRTAGNSNPILHPLLNPAAQLPARSRDRNRLLSGALLWSTRFRPTFRRFPCWSKRHEIGRGLC